MRKSIARTYAFVEDDSVRVIVTDGNADGKTSSRAFYCDNLGKALGFGAHCTILSRYFSHSQ
jgi:hypothetical protein